MVGQGTTNPPLDQLIPVDPTLIAHEIDYQLIPVDPTIPTHEIDDNPNIENLRENYIQELVRVS